MAQHTKVLVIGGGIGGFGNALALRRLGAEVELVEQAQATRGDCAEAASEPAGKHVAAR